MPFNMKKDESPLATIALLSINGDKTLVLRDKSSTGVDKGRLSC
jgi:hypothetical protein